MGEKDSFGGEEAEDGGRISREPRGSIGFVDRPQAAQIGVALLARGAGPAGEAQQ
jgi:hypothetical protein